jgi:transposase
MAKSAKNGSKITLETKHHRTFSDSLKRKLIKDLQQGLTTKKIICELHNISRTSLYNWIHEYSNSDKVVKTVIQMESEAEKTKLLMLRVSELERQVGIKHLEVEYLNKLLELESEELGYDIKKKERPQLLNGLDTIMKTRILK